MASNRPLAMLAVLGGALALLLGFAVLLLPLLLPELSRARDAVWGALVLLLGLVLVTSAERLTGAPMLGVLCGGLLIGRLGVEVGQGRWRQLTAEEQRRLGSAERWQKALGEAGSAGGRLLELARQWSAAAGLWLRQRRQPRSSGKLWVRPERGAAPAAQAVVAAAPAEEATDRAQPADPAEPAEPARAEPADVTEAAAVVRSFAQIDALIEASAEPPGPAEFADRPEHGPEDGPDAAGASSRTG